MQREYSLLLGNILRNLVFDTCGSNPSFSSVKDWVNSSQVDDSAGLNCSAEVTNRSRSINIDDTDARSPKDLL